MALDASQKAFVAAYTETGSIAAAIAASHDPAKVALQQESERTDEHNNPLENVVIDLDDTDAKSVPLNPQQTRFVNEFFLTGNASLAARRAGFSHDTAGQTGHYLLRRPNVARRLHELHVQQAKHSHMTAQQVLDMLTYLGTSDPRSLYHNDGTPKGIHELDTATAQAIKSTKTVYRKTGELDQDGKPVLEMIHEFTFWDKPVALDKMAKFHGILADRPEIDPMAVEELELKRAMRRKLLLELGNSAKTINPDGTEA